MKVTVFCSSSEVVSEGYISLAQELGSLLAKNNHTLVYGGANVGLMRHVANSALSHGGEVIGVIPELIADKELAHNGLTQLIVTSDMHERKKMLEQLADAFVVLPGGFGTYDELFQVLTERQLELHHKPIIIVNFNGFYNGTLSQIEYAIHEKFIHQGYKNLFSVADNANTCMEILQKPISLNITSKWYKDNLNR